MLWNGVPLDQAGLRPPSSQHRHDCLLCQGGCCTAPKDCSAVAGGEWMIMAVESYLAVRRAAGRVLNGVVTVGP
jgi:hypothetical protein